MKSAKRWLVSILLFTPVILLYTGHYLSFLKNDQMLPTGFIQNDMPYYMANAREHFDGNTFSLAYPLPFSARYDNPAIYFQPHILLLALTWRLLQTDPGVLFCLFGFLSGVICLRICLEIYDALVGLERPVQQLGLVLFCWGGGLLSVAAILYNVLIGHADVAAATMNAFIFDPGRGWWFLNLGRNLVYPTEAYYHALFFGVVYCLLKQHYKTVLLLTLILSFSHPFTGIALILILLTWSVLEQLYLKSRILPAYFLPVLLLLLLLHLAYYFVVLGRDPEHKLLMEQWKLPWVTMAVNFIPAYVLVGILAFLRVATPRLLQQFLSAPFNRFCLVWVLVNFALENHEFAFEPHQPVHFTRGYVWAGLFLIGAPALIELVEKVIRRVRYPFFSYFLIFLACVLFLSDNLVWFGVNAYNQYNGSGITTTVDQKEVLSFLNRDFRPGHLLVSQDLKVGYLSTVYTPYRALVSHVANTPHSLEKRDMIDALFDNCRLDAALRGTQLVIVGSKKTNLGARCLAAASPAPTYVKIFENDSYEVFLLQ